MREGKTGRETETETERERERGREGERERGRERNELKFLTQLIRGSGKEKWSKTAGRYSMGFEVQTVSK